MFKNDGKKNLYLTKVCKECSIQGGVNPVSANSDQHEISPNNIHTMSREKVMRIEHREDAVIFYQIPSIHSLRKCIEISLENL